MMMNNETAEGVVSLRTTHFKIVASQPCWSQWILVPHLEPKVVSGANDNIRFLVEDELHNQLELLRNRASHGSSVDLISSLGPEGS